MRKRWLFVEGILAVAILAGLVAIDQVTVRKRVWGTRIEGEIVFPYCPVCARVRARGILGSTRVLETPLSKWLDQRGVPDHQHVWHTIPHHHLHALEFLHGRWLSLLGFLENNVSRDFALQVVATSLSPAWERQFDFLEWRLWDMQWHMEGRASSYSPTLEELARCWKITTGQSSLEAAARALFDTGEERLQLWAIELCGEERLWSRPEAIAVLEDALGSSHEEVRFQARCAADAYERVRPSLEPPGRELTTRPGATRPQA